MNGSLHFVGIGGIGMSAIASILLSRGERVTGSDVSESGLIEELRRRGAVIAIGHDERNINGARAVVVSSAIDSQNPEYRYALQTGVPIVRRGEMLRRIMDGRRGIAICGTHGKTTTTAMTAAAIRAGGIDASLVLGGIELATGTNSHDGSSRWFLTEADESDGSFALLDPAIAVVTNIENDHLSSDEDLPKLVEGFDAFLGKLPSDGAAIVGIDNDHARSLAQGSRKARTVTFGLAPDADLCAANVAFADLGSTFDVTAHGVSLGTAALRVPGEMNVQNALAAIAAALELRIPFARISHALSGFAGVHRRFEILARTQRMTVVDDYAHHPTAVRATIAAARQYHQGPVVAAFQPHRYTRTAHLAREFAEALRGADAVYLAPVYAASEAPIEGISERSIGEPLAAAGARVRYVKYVHDLRATLAREAPSGALVLMLGAGNITKVAAELARDLTQGVRA